MLLILHSLQTTRPLLTHFIKFFNLLGIGEKGTYMRACLDIVSFFFFLFLKNTVKLCLVQQMSFLCRSARSSPARAFTATVITYPRFPGKPLDLSEIRLDSFSQN